MTKIIINYIIKKAIGWEDFKQVAITKANTANIPTWFDNVQVESL